MSKQFVQKSFDLILLIKNYYFEELPINYMHTSKTFTVLLWKFETVLSRILRSQTVGQKNDWRFKQQMQYIAHILSNRPYITFTKFNFLKTLQIYKLNQNLLFVFCIFVCLHILDNQNNSASLDNQNGKTPPFIYWFLSTESKQDYFPL